MVLVLVRSGAVLAAVAAAVLAFAGAAARRATEADTVAEIDRLEAAAAVQRERGWFLESALDAVVAGRLSLADAAGAVAARRFSDPVYTDGVRLTYPAPTADESAALMLLYRIRVRLREAYPAYAAAVIARVCDEYQGRYGVHPDDRRTAWNPGRNPSSAARPATLLPTNCLPER
jgi:hypothetical protein